MNPLTELVRLISEGASRTEIYSFFTIHDFEPIETDEFLHLVGVQFPQRNKDYGSVTIERRQQLLILSLSDDL